MSHTPFLRVLIPFVLGILFELYIKTDGRNYLLLFFLLPLALLPVLLNKSRGFLKIFSLVVVDLCLFFLAVELTKKSQLIYDKDSLSSILTSDSVACVARVNDIPVNKPASKKILLKVYQIKSQDKYTHTKGNILAYFQKSALVNQLKAGDWLYIKTRLAEIKESPNPGMFNLKQYFNDRGIYHTTYIDSCSYSIINNAKYGFSLWNFGLSIKTAIINRLKSSGLTNEAYSICAALITGYDADLDKQVSASFAESGTMHILSVSGLHVGLIYLILTSFTSFIDRKKRYKAMQFFIITIFLWFFGLLTGFAPPVLRAVIMFTLLGFGRLYFRNKTSNQINILFVAAFLLLFYNPLYIRDVGFLFSFSALFGILYFVPKLELVYTPENKTIYYFYSSALASVAATITTLPLTLFYFHQFPVCFIPANIFLVPLAFVMLIFSFISLFKISTLIWLANKITTLMFWLADFFSFAIKGIHFTLVDSFLMAAFIFFTNQWLNKRKYVFAIQAFLILIIWQSYSVYDAWRNKTESSVTVLHVPKKFALLIKNRTALFLKKDDSLDYNFYIQPVVNTYNYPHITFTRFNYLQYGGFNLLHIQDKSKIPKGAFVINTIVISGNAIPPESFFRKHVISRLVADGSNTHFNIIKMRQICSKFGIEFYSTNENGAYTKRFL